MPKYATARHFSAPKYFIWPSYGQKMARMPIFGHTLLTITQPFLGQLDCIFFRNSGDYYLSISGEKSKLWCPFSTFDFLVVATTHASNGLGPSNPTKNLAHWVNFLGQPLSRNHVFKIFRGEPPLKELYYDYEIIAFAHEIRGLSGSTIFSMRYT